MSNQITLTGARLKELEIFILKSLRATYDLKQITKNILTEANRLAAYEPNPTSPNKTHGSPTPNLQ